MMVISRSLPQSVYLKFTAFIFGCVLCCACQANTTSMPAQPTSASPASETPAGLLDPADFTALLEKAAQNGSVRVIITLEIGQPFQPEGYLPDEAAVQAQRDAIKAAQETLLQELSPYQFSVDFQSDFTPQIALTIDEPGLRAVIASAAVIGLQEDIPAKPMP